MLQDTDIRRARMITILTCADCGLEKFKYRPREKKGKQPARCRRCWGKEFKSISFLAVSEACINCWSTIRVEWAQYMNWREKRRCEPCGGLPARYTAASQAAPMPDAEK